jgi:hypothetical protein
MKSLLTGAERSPNFCASIRAAAAKRVAGSMMGWQHLQPSAPNW